MSYDYFYEAIPQLRQQLSIKESAVANGMYAWEPKELRAAIEAYGQIGTVAGVPIAHDLGNLTTMDSRNVVRRARLADNRTVSIKVIGSLKEPGEGAWLDAANRLSLPTLPLLEHSVRSVELGQCRRSVQVVVTDFIDASTLQELGPSRAGKSECLKTVARMTGLIGRFHEAFASAGVRIPGARSWEARMMLHLSQTNRSVRKAGLALPRAWEFGLRRLSGAGTQLLHGDAAPVNTLITDRGVLLFDPPGAVVGPREADYGQMAAQVGNVKHVRAAVAEICRLRPDLNADLVAATAGFSFQQWAGYAASAHWNPDALEHDSDPLERAAALLEMAEQLTSSVTRRCEAFQKSEINFSLTGARSSLT